MKRNTYWLVALCLVILLALAGCFGGGSDTSSAGTDNGGGGGSQTTGGDTGEGTGGGADSGGSAPGGEAPVADAAGEAVPEDVPVMPGAYNLDVIREGTQVNYTVDADIDTIMSFYQEELAALGWKETRAPDSAVGAIGSMSRENDAGDKISLNMSYNQISGATTIAIAISRHGAGGGG